MENLLSRYGAEVKPAWFSALDAQCIELLAAFLSLSGSRLRGQPPESVLKKRKKIGAAVAGLITRILGATRRLLNFFSPASRVGTQGCGGFSWHSDGVAQS
jgi:hypothetical protein